LIEEFRPFSSLLSGMKRIKIKNFETLIFRALNERKSKEKSERRISFLERFLFLYSLNSSLRELSE